MSVQINYPFDNSSNYIYDTTKVDISGGSAQLKLNNNTGQTFTQGFSSDTGFVYDATFAEFTGGLVRQKDTRPADATLYASFVVDEDSSWADGSTNNTLVGGATWDSGRIDLTGNSGKRLNMPGGSGNFDIVGSAGCIRFTYRPDYGILIGVRQIFEYDAATGNNNAIIMYQNGSSVIVDLRDSAGAQHLLIANVGNFTQGQDYVFELNFDFDSTSRFFVDGVQKGSLNTSSWTRVAEGGTFKWGGATGAGDFWLDDVILFSSVQHTTDHSGELPYTYYDYVYMTSKVELPSFTYAGVGAIQAFTNIASTESGNPKYVINDLYYSGGWTTSDGSYAQASSITDVLNNIATLPVSDTVNIDIVFPNDNSTQSNVSNLILTYTGQTYPTDNPTILFSSSFRNEGLIEFEETSTKTGNDEIKYVLKKNGSYYYWNGSSWTISDETYAQASTATEINTNASTFTTTHITTYVKAFLHSDTGLTTPTLENVLISYDFSAEQIDTIETCIVWGYNYDVDGTISTTTFTVALTESEVKYKTASMVRRELKTVTPDSSGYWEAELIETTNMEGTPKYVFNFSDNKIEYRSVPNQSSINYYSLT